MTFGEFWKLYTEDVKNYVKLNTWLTKEHIVDTKILPYFKNLKMNEITPGDVRKWQNEMVAFRNENGKSYSQTYKKTMHNILSTIFNHACRFYNLKSNPARQAGNMGREEKKEMLFWTTEEYKKFSEAVIDKPVSFYAFEMLYWTGMRLGELLALTMEDFDFEKNTVRMNKSYQRLQGRDVITTPKTPKSNRTNATSMCISSPILLIVLVTMAEDGVFHVSESLATVFGCVFLLGMVAAAVFLFITYGMRESHMEHFEKECFETEYGVSGIVREKKIPMNRFLSEEQLLG